MLQNTKRYDFEEERLDIKNFVIDYFEYRISQDGEEWHESPGLADGVQEEYLALRNVATLFEKRREKDLKNMIQTILSDSQLAFPRFCDVLEQLGNDEFNNSKDMSYGRLVGIISFAGYLAVALFRNNQRREVQQILLYTSAFIGTRIRLSWATESLSWKKFMEFVERIEERQRRKAEEERRRSRRLSIGIGIGVLIAGVVGSKYFNR